ncbi:MAG TPA: hypothetical protein VGQ57_20110, partial [Polyangiaceae bacterium]|nr:hypothetical protein [Polyangiaceae bacterium]
YTPMFENFGALDEVLERLPQPHDLAKVSDFDHQQRGVLRKMTLPRASAGALMARLHAEGVSGLTMFPSLAGVAPYLRERIKFGIPPREF